jgi:hypothetical protein
MRKGLWGLPQRNNSERGDWFHKEKPRWATGRGSVLIVGRGSGPHPFMFAANTSELGRRHLSRVPFSQHCLKIDNKQFVLKNTSAGSRAIVTSNSLI